MSPQPMWVAAAGQLSQLWTTAATRAAATPWWWQPGRTSRKKIWVGRPKLETLPPADYVDTRLPGLIKNALIIMFAISKLMVYCTYFLGQVRLTSKLRQKCDGMICFLGRSIFLLKKQTYWSDQFSVPALQVIQRPLPQLKWGANQTTSCQLKSRQSKVIAHPPLGQTRVIQPCLASMTSRRWQPETTATPCCQQPQARSQQLSVVRCHTKSSRWTAKGLVTSSSRYSEFLWKILYLKGNLEDL